MLLAVALLHAEEKKPEIERAKRTTLSEKQQLQFENAQLKLQILQMQERQFNEVLQGIVAEACKSMGGSSDADCSVIPPNQAEKSITVVLRAKPAPAGDKAAK